MNKADVLSIARQQLSDAISRFQNHLRSAESYACLRNTSAGMTGDCNRNCAGLGPH